MTRAGILTKYRPGIHATRNGKSLMRAGKILQMVNEARETMGKRGVSVRVGGKRIEGAREKKIGALGSPDRNIDPPALWQPSPPVNRAAMSRATPLMNLGVPGEGAADARK